MYARALSENLYVHTLFVQFYSIDMYRYQKRPTHSIHKSDQCWMIAILSVLKIVYCTGASSGFQPNQGKNTKF